MSRLAQAGRNFDAVSQTAMAGRFQCELDPWFLNTDRMAGEIVGPEPWPS
jgi:hypothetical protein